MELIPHLLEHAFHDTIYLVPFLFVTYLLLELLEHKASDHAAELVRKAGFAGPLVGALLGAVPQCGFSAAGSALYASRAITLGTLFAVFLSTSDEMLPLFVANQVDPFVMLSILGCKVAIGMVMGFAIDGLLRLRLRQALCREEATLDEAEHGTKTRELALEGEGVHHTHQHDLIEELEQPFSPHHCQNPSCSVTKEEGTWKEILWSAVKHTLQVSIIVYVISLALVAIMEIAGEEALTNFLATNPGIAIFGSALVGLIPNCGASVVITQLYLDGMLGTGAMMSGLLVSAGVGLLVLFGENHRLSQNLIILAGLFLTGIVWGLIFQAAGIHFI